MPSSHVIELRQYTLHPGKRDILVELFERELVGLSVPERRPATGAGRHLTSLVVAILRLEPTGRSLLGQGAPAPVPAGFTTGRTGDPHDFDFLEGEWEVVNRRLAVRGGGSVTWEEFPATSVCRRHLGGLANVEEIVFPTKGWAGMTLRTFDVERRQWSIHWISSRTGRLYPPVVGGFAAGRGEFYGEDEDGGRPVKVRFVWLRLGRDSARWEQSFSFDGRAWESNWVMDLRRKGVPAT